MLQDLSHLCIIELAYKQHYEHTKKKNPKLRGNMKVKITFDKTKHYTWMMNSTLIRDDITAVKESDSMKIDVYTCGLAEKHE
jgi:hypothetical protein